MMIANDARQRREVQARRNAAEYYTRDYLRPIDKTNILISLLRSSNDVRFENVYVYLKSAKLSISRHFIYAVDEIYFTFSNNSDVVSLH